MSYTAGSSMRTLGGSNPLVLMFRIKLFCDNDIGDNEPANQAVTEVAGMREDIRREHLGDLQGPMQFASTVRADGAWQEALDRLALLACEILDVPIAQINVILGDEQASLSSVGKDAEWDAWNGPRSVPVEGTYCQHVLRSGTPLAIEDASTHPLVKDNAATTSGGVRSYLAVPLKNAEGRTLATLCVVDFKQREWEPASLATLSSLADLLMREIRSRIHAEANLHREEARFRALIEQGDDLITILALDWTIAYQSPAYERLLGYPGGSLLGTPFIKLIHPEDLARYRDRFAPALQEPGSRASGEWRMRHRDESWRTVDVKGANLLHDPAVRGTVLNILDVSREKRVERELHQAQKMEAVGRLAGGVAHDFNNLLTAIKGNSAFLLARGDLSPEAEADTREMLDAADRASDLTKQLLSFSREQVLDVKVVDLGAAAEKVVPLIKRLLGAKITLSLDFERDLLTLADEGQVGQIIMNLAVNARDAMPTGGTLHLETRLADVGRHQAGSHGAIKPGHYALLIVSDNGVGMSPRVQQNIFDPFFTTKPDSQGTGLGLSIVWGVLSQMGGHIHLYSEPGRGTTFRLYFPLAASGSGADIVEQRSPGEAASDEVSLGTILVVEDQPEVRRVMTKTLSRAGHTVLEADSGERALEIAATMEGSPDLLLTDVLLPGMTGAEVAWRLVEQWPELKVVFTSGFTRGELLNQQVELKNAGFLPKPFGPDELSRIVSDALRLCPTTGEPALQSASLST